MSAMSFTLTHIAFILIETFHHTMLYMYSLSKKLMPFRTVIFTNACVTVINVYPVDVSKA